MVAFAPAAGVMAAAGGIVVAVDQVPAATSGDRSALYASVTAVLVALIGGAVAIVTSRRKDAEPPSIRYVDPPTSNALPAAMAELYEYVKDELDTMTVERDLWRQRARSLGWADKDTG